MKLTNADMLIRKYIDSDIKKFSNSDVKIVLENLKQNILKAPSIDLVCCKECRFCKLEGDDEEGTHYLWCWKHDTDVNETDFCSRGERKESE